MTLLLLLLLLLPPGHLQDVALSPLLGQLLDTAESLLILLLCHQGTD